MKNIIFDSVVEKVAEREKRLEKQSKHQSPLKTLYIFLKKEILIILEETTTKEDMPKINLDEGG